MIRLLIALTLGISAALISTMATAAERIAFNFSPFGQFYIQVDDIETFIKTSKVSSELAYYLNRLPPEQVDKLPDLLSTSLEFDPLAISKFSNSTIGETVIKNFGKGIRTRTNSNGFFALRSAIIAAAFDSEELTIINLLNKFPLDTIYIDISVLDRYVERGEEIFSNRLAIDELFFSGRLNINNKKNLEFELTHPGKYTWQKETFSYQNTHRNRLGKFDLYLTESKSSPLIIISHGLASNRQTFDYLGEHLASHGFAVAIVEHDDISLNKFDNFLSGKDAFPEPNNLIDQPLDVKHIIDRLEELSNSNSRLKNRIDLAKIGIIGHSFGGYTSLALAGGELMVNQNAPKCKTENYRNIILDLSSLAKCTFNEFYATNRQLKDPRIKAAIAINPMGKIFGAEGMKAIDVPTMIVSGTNDIVMPPVAEQILPFSWLNQDLDKYLVLVKPGTHFSFLREGLGVLPVPDTVVGISPTQAYPVIKALTISFFKTHLTPEKEYQEYLLGDLKNRFHLIENSSFQLSIIRSLDRIYLQQLIKNQ